MLLVWLYNLSSADKARYQVERTVLACALDSKLLSFGLKTPEKSGVFTFPGGTPHVALGVYGSSEQPHESRRVQ